MTNIDPAIVEAVAEWFGENLTHEAFQGKTDEELAEHLAPLIAAAVDAARAEGEKQGAARVREAVEAVHQRRECVVYDEIDCADGDCDHPEGTCVVVATAVCGHCADQTEPNGAWEHIIREAAYWPCATLRALTEAAPHD